jgi:hypothetical protein
MVAVIVLVGIEDCVSEGAPGVEDCAVAEDEEDDLQPAKRTRATSREAAERWPMKEVSECDEKDEVRSPVVRTRRNSGMPRSTVG